MARKAGKLSGFFSYKDNDLIRSHFSSLTISFSLNYFLKVALSKYGHSGGPGFSIGVGGWGTRRDIQSIIALSHFQ